MTDIDLRSATAELIARERIRDCLFRYCRGIDRTDEAMLRSAYWPDGTDNHGPYNGSAQGFIDWALRTLPTIERGIHQIHNVLIEFRDGGAAVESYFSAFQRQLDASGRMVQWDMKGRYLDWFTEREGEWRVLNRLVVFDWVEEMPLPPGTEAERFALRKPIGARYPDDPVYSFF
jgi:hypothetical protein